MDYYDKYLKYKSKYNKLKGGGAGYSKAINDFIRDTTELINKYTTDIKTEENIIDVNAKLLPKKDNKKDDIEKKILAAGEKIESLQTKLFTDELNITNKYNVLLQKEHAKSHADIINSISKKEEKRK